MFNITQQYIKVYKKLHNKQEIAYSLQWQANKMKTLEEVRNEFERRGESITCWAKKHGYPFHLVQQVLSGRSRCLRGKSHEIAVLLEIKDGIIVCEAAPRKE